MRTINQLPLFARGTWGQASEWELHAREDALSEIMALPETATSDQMNNAARAAGQPPACEKFLGTTNTVLCYRQTRRSLRVCFEHCLVKVFVAQEASFVCKITNNPG
jgi:hypothetical protein